MNNVAVKCIHDLKHDLNAYMTFKEDVHLCCYCRVSSSSGEAGTRTRIMALVYRLMSTPKCP